VTRWPVRANLPDIQNTEREDYMRRLLLATTAIVAAGYALPAAAQSAEDGANNEDTIVVTARKREESLLNVPLPVSVATQAQLEREQIRGVDDLQRVTPALEISQTSGGEANGGARIRGLGTGVFNASVSPSVAFVIDNVAQGNLSFPLLFDMAQVEVLRGPQGTLFGQGASAGVIKIATVSPTDQEFLVKGGFEFADKGTAGSEFGNQVFNGAVNIPITEGMALRVAGQYQRETGLQRNTFTNRDNEITDFGIRAKLLMEPSDSTKFLINVEYAKRTDDAWNFFTPIQVGTDAAVNAQYAACGVVPSTRAELFCSQFPNYQTKQVFGVSIVLEQEISDSLNLTSVSSYRKSNARISSVDFTRRVGAPSANNENIQNEAEQFGQELNLSYKGEGFDLIVGGMYQRYTFDTSPLVNKPFNQTTPGNRTGFSVCPYNGNFTIPFPFPNFVNFGCVPFIYGIGRPTVRFSLEETQNSTTAVYADATINLSSQFDIFGGVRYSHFQNSTGVAYDAYTPTSSASITDNNVSGRFGLSYRPSDTTSFYASAALGYKPPAVVISVNNPLPNFLKPEKSAAFELGGRLQAGRVLLSGNVFYTRVRNFQAQSQEIVASQLLATAKNIEAITSYGFEINANGRVSDNFTINAGYQFNRATYAAGVCGNDDVDVAPANGICDGNLGNQQVRNAPKHKFTLSGEYSAPLGASLELFLNANVVYKSAVRVEDYASPLYTYKAHELINAGFGIRDADGAWTLSVFARNLTKEREPVAYLGNTSEGIRGWPGAGRTARIIGVTGGFNF
jgi:iron complex outermembrane recepter protein